MPETRSAAPVKEGIGGLTPVTEGLDPFVPMLLTIKDGQGVPSDNDGLLRVTVTSGAGPEAQAVPQAARTVEDCALTAAAATRAKLAAKSFMTAVLPRLVRRRDQLWEID